MKHKLKILILIGLMVLTSACQKTGVQEAYQLKTKALFARQAQMLIKARQLASGGKYVKASYVPSYAANGTIISSNPADNFSGVAPFISPSAFTGSMTSLDMVNALGRLYQLLVQQRFYGSSIGALGFQSMDPSTANGFSGFIGNALWQNPNQQVVSPLFSNQNTSFGNIFGSGYNSVNPLGQYYGFGGVPQTVFSQ